MGAQVHERNSHILLKIVLFEASFLRRRSLVYPLLVLCVNYLLQMPSFSVLRLWYTYVDSHPNRVSKSTHKRLKKCSKFAKKCALKA